MSFVYKGLKANFEKLTVTEHELDRQMDRLRQQTPRVIPVTERAAKMGDDVVLDYAGFVDGKQFDGGTAKEQVLTLGSGMFIPGFESQLVGAHAGSDVLVTVTFPKDYRATELAGKPAEFRCHIVEVREKSAYELDDVFAKEVGGCQTLGEMKQKLRQSLQDYYDERAEMEVQDTLMRQGSCNARLHAKRAGAERRYRRAGRAFKGAAGAQGLDAGGISPVHRQNRAADPRRRKARGGKQPAHSEICRAHCSSRRSYCDGRGLCQRACCHLPAERADHGAAEASYERAVRSQRPRQHPHEEGNRLCAGQMRT